MSRYRAQVRPDPMPGDLVEGISRWIGEASGSTDLAKLLTCLERRYWIDRVVVCPVTRWAIPADLLARMRRRVAEIVEAEFDGHWACGKTVIRSDGDKFWTEMAEAAPAGHECPVRFFPVSQIQPKKGGKA